MRRFELDDLVNRPGTYFNPQTEMVLVVDDSTHLDAELFDSDDAEESEYDALMTAADASAALVAGLPDGQRRRVVVVAETATADAPVRWRDVVAVHVDTEDDADADDDLAWWATQEIGDLVAAR